MQRRKGSQGFIGSTWTPKVCKMMALRLVIMGLGLLFHIFFGVQVGIRGLGLGGEGV